MNCGANTPHLITAIYASIMLDRPQPPDRPASTSTTRPKTRTHRQDRPTDPTKYYPAAGTLRLLTVIRCGS